LKTAIAQPYSHAVASQEEEKRTHFTGRIFFSSISKTYSGIDNILKSQFVGRLIPCEKRGSNSRAKFSNVGLQRVKMTETTIIHSSTAQFLIFRS